MVDRDPKIKVIYYLVGFLDIFSHLLCWLPSLVCLFSPDLGSGETQSRRFSVDQNTHPPIGNLIITKLFYSQFRQWPCLIPLDLWLPLSGIIRPTLFLCIFQNCKKRHNKTHNRQNENNKQNTHSSLYGMHGALWDEYSTEVDGKNEVSNLPSQRCQMFGKIKTTFYPIYSGKGKWYYCCYQRESHKYNRILWLARTKSVELEKSSWGNIQASPSYTWEWGVMVHLDSQIYGTFLQKIRDAHICISLCNILGGS